MTTDGDADEPVRGHHHRPLVHVRPQVGRRLEQLGTDERAAPGEQCRRRLRRLGAWRR